MATSPLTALVWVFAVSAGALGAVGAGALGLASRHQRRRKDGVFAAILAGNPASEARAVLTVTDYLRDPGLREQIKLPLAAEADSYPRRPHRPQL